MKTTFKKSALAFLTCVLALAFALTGCSGGGKDPKADFVGSWKFSGGTVEGEELTDEYMDMLEEGGASTVSWSSMRTARAPSTCSLRSSTLSGRPRMPQPQPSLPKANRRI